MLPIGFDITSDGPVSWMFREQGLLTFADAAQYVRMLPYGRNADKQDVLAVLKERMGTCSTKHALLYRLARENGAERIELVMGMYRMHGGNTRGVAEVLAASGLAYVPEAHCYLSVGAVRMDMTRRGAQPKDFEQDLLEEVVILPEQIGQYKVDYHRAYLTKWLGDQKQLAYDADELWAIREQCIAALSHTG